METVSFAPGTTLLRAGEKPDTILMITSGGIIGSSDKGELILSKGDIPGIFDFFCGYSYYTYVASDDLTCLKYKVAGDDGIEKLLGSNADLNDLFAATMCRQCCSILDDFLLQQYNCNNFYNYITESYAEYVNLCHKFSITPKQLSEIESLAPFHPEEELPAYLGGYYETLRDLEPALRSALFHDHPEYTYGFLQKTAEDIHHIFECLQMILDYQSDTAYLLLNSHHTDLFDLYTSLSLQVQRLQEDTIPINADISKIMIQLEGQASIDRTLFQSRVASYKKQAAAIESNMQTSATVTAGLDIPEELKNSAKTILAYADYPQEQTQSFLADLEKYRKVNDRSATDDETTALRKRLTAAFYNVYTSAFQLSLTDSKIPAAVLLFLLFGYMDEELSGIENVAALYQLSQNSLNDTAHHIYTLYEWLQTIYRGEKEPSRNEFDSDYPQYLRELRYTGKITEEAEKRMLGDRAQKVMFELKNMFPIVNKTTCGRITTFCPIFSEHTCLRSPSEMLVTSEKMQKAVKAIRSIDYSAFYRETMFTLPESGINYQTIQVEILPDIILMPNIGSRGILWQEIEEKRRTTPSRMMFSLFCTEDIIMLYTRLVGEYRWEMCKRVQGARWNDVTDPSLTGEYFDYVQFYKKNMDLSPDAKEKVKLSLQRAKNSYREMFVRDYVQWIYYESTGSPRLNKVARRILFRYCPFSAPFRSKLQMNPLYKEALSRHDIQKAQKLHQLGNVLQKLQNLGKPVSKELYDQQRFLEM